MNFVLFETVLRFIERVFGFLYGTLTPLVSILLIFTTAIDFVYLLVPIFQTAMDKLLDGKRAGGFRLVSNDAISSLEEAHTSRESCMLIYLKKRARTYFYVTILFYLVLGGLPKAMSFILAYASSILENWGLIK